MPMLFSSVGYRHGDVGKDDPADQRMSFVFTDHTEINSPLPFAGEGLGVRDYARDTITRNPRSSPLLNGTYPLRAPQHNCSISLP